MNAIAPQRRVAVLHTGEQLEFPANTPDHIVHRTVRQKMGLPPPEPSNSEVMNTAIGGLQALLRQFAQVADTIAQASMNVQGAAQSLADVGQSLAQLNDAVGQLHSSVSKPKRAVRNADGSWHTEPVEN